MPTPLWQDFDYHQWLNSVQSFQPRLLGEAQFFESGPRKGQFSTPEWIAANLPSDIHIALQNADIFKLFAHQVASYEAFLKGGNVLVTTGTNSGKSLCYHLPMLEILSKEPNARAIYLYPTKALAHDQLQKFEKFGPSWVKLAEYDGDTPSKRRSAIRKEAQIILTNPDMLHSSILPNHELWAPFLRSLKLIALDEMHVYKGVFGSNVANVLRRLEILSAWHHAHPQIIAASATLSNGTETFETLTGKKCSWIQADQSASGILRFILLPPSLTIERAESANGLAARLMVSLVNSGARVITFNKSRQGAELVGRFARQVVLDQDGSPAIFETYRGGYTSKERKEIEKNIFTGFLRGVSTTSALELGIDLGDLDVVIINGFPGSMSSFWQQAGRAGRGNRAGLVIYIAGNDPLETFICDSFSLERRGQGEAVSLRPENPQLLGAGLLCAAYERPISEAELNLFGDSGIEVARELDVRGDLQWSNNRFYYPRFEPPARKFGLRGGLSGSVKLMYDGVEIGSLDRRQALSQAFPGAIYLHRQQVFVCTQLDLRNGIATLEPTTNDAITSAHFQVLVSNEIPIEVEENEGYSTGLFGVHIEERVLGYERRSFGGNQSNDYHDLNLPPETYDTVAFKLTLSLRDHYGPDWLKGIHAVEHILNSLAPHFAGCDGQDLGSAWGADTVEDSEMQDSAWVIIYDRFPGGIGLSEKLFEMRSLWIDACLNRVLNCECVDGCPLCILSPRCSIKNQFLSKSGAELILSSFCGSS